MGLRRILEDLGDAMKNRNAAVGVAVFGNIETAPTRVTFTQFGDKAVLVLDKDDLDPGAVRLAYMWARWVARRKLSETDSAIGVERVDSLIADATRALEQARQVRKCHTMAKKVIDEAGAHLDTMTCELDTIFGSLRQEIQKAA
jgi:hypothetical protein